MLKNWLMAPLQNVDKIQRRLDAVEDMIEHQHETDVLRARLRKLPDLERLMAKIFTYSLKHKIKAIYFEDVSLQKMREFRKLLLCLGEVTHTIGSYLDLIKKGDLKSERLRVLLTEEQQQDDDENNCKSQFDNENTEGFSENSGGLLPANILESIREFDKLIAWKKAKGINNLEIPEPQRGIDEEFDAANEAVDLIKAKLDAYLQTIVQKFKDRRIAFSHAKNRYEIEVPEEHIKGNRKPPEFELCSTRQGFQRFQTPEQKSLVDKLEVAEDRLKDALAPFLTAIFSKFYSQKLKWLRVLNILTEMDCLASLAIVSGQSDHTMCRPKFVDPSPEGFGRLDLRQMIHPCVTLTGQKNLIPNDTFLDPNQGQMLLLVTGPNMGGKSTLLRQTALAVILAQIGCFVPAQSCELTAVDRIFTRIGASDRILEGKSTFYVEMEETKNVLQYATPRSLAILDELGRGTSTFDGFSIADAVMRYLVGQSRCLTLFSTHYHMLLDAFRNFEGVKNYHMAFMADKEEDRIIFLYKFIAGECP